MVLVRPIEYDDVTAAIELLMDGSLMPEFEDVTKVDHYWSAVEEMRRQRGDVVVAEVNGEVVGVCQVIIFQHFQHAGAGAARSKACTCEAIAAVAASSPDAARGRGARARTRLLSIQLTSRNVREALTGLPGQRLRPDSQGFKKFFD